MFASSSLIDNTSADQEFESLQLLVRRCPALVYFSFIGRVRPLISKPVAHLITMSVGVSGNSGVGKSFGPMSMNIHGSMPTAQSDSRFEPNFRQFDFFLDSAEVPNEHLVERVFKNPEGQSHWDLRTFWTTNLRCTPVVVTSIFGAAFVNFFYTRFLNRTGTSMRWSFFKCYAGVLAWNNFTKYYARERYFQRDFQRNQLYSFDELRDQRDKQRVREALFAQNFVKDPVSEYRVKAWQVSNRFA